MEFERVNKDIINIGQSSLEDHMSGVTRNNYYDDKEHCKNRAELEKRFEDKFRDAKDLSKLVTYQGNKNIPFLSTYRYKEAFSFQLVDAILRNFNDEEDLTVFDPYSGMGTTLFASAVNEIEAYSIDRLPLAVKMSNSILDSVTVDLDSVASELRKISDNLDSYEEAEIAEDVNVVGRVFPDEMLSELKKWKSAISNVENEKVRSTLNMAFLSILIDCSYAKNSGQFLRTDKTQELANPEKAMKQKIDALSKSQSVNMPTEDYSYFDKNEAYEGDSRDIDLDIPEPNMIITSPPYPNRYDYTRSYSLELAFEFVDTNQDLINLRHDLLRSHIESKVDEEDFKRNHPAVAEVIDALEDKDLNNNKIPDMLVGYFKDMEESFEEFSNLLADKSRIFLVVDNVRYEGEVIPVDLILADMAEKEGFELKNLLITRYKGNSSQQMGEYDRVPVRESILWLERGY